VGIVPAHRWILGTVGTERRRSTRRSRGSTQAISSTTRSRSTGA